MHWIYQRKFCTVGFWTDWKRSNYYWTGYSPELVVIVILHISMFTKSGCAPGILQSFFGSSPEVLQVFFWSSPAIFRQLSTSSCSNHSVIKIKQPRNWNEINPKIGLKINPIKGWKATLRRGRKQTSKGEWKPAPKGRRSSDEINLNKGFKVQKIQFSSFQYNH